MLCRGWNYNCNILLLTAESALMLLDTAMQRRSKYFTSLSLREVELHVYCSVSSHASYCKADSCHQEVRQGA